MHALPGPRSALALLLAFFTAQVSFAAAPAATLPNVDYTASEVIALWPGAAPGETAPIGPEYVIPDRPRPFDQVTDVSVPTLSVFLPPPAKRNGTALLVLPGGGLERLALEHEGHEVAEWLNAHGIAAFVLKYRVPPRDPARRWQAGLQDAQRAMSLLRARAAAWQLDPAAIGSIGFSAGAEIDLMLSVYRRDGDRQYPRIDDIDDFSTRPDFNIAIYGGGFANARENTLREDIAARIDARTPPMFIVHAFDDQALNSIILMNALKRAGVASELHIFPAGAHGFGVRETSLPVGRWRELALEWLAWQGHLDAPAVRAYARDFVHATDHGSAALPRFSAVQPDADLASAFAAQRRIVRTALANGAEIAGYKGAYTSTAAQNANGVSQPLHGVLFKAGRSDAAAQPAIALDPERPILIETEIGFVIATDIATQLRVPRQAMTAIEAIVPVVELPANVAARMPGTARALDVVAANVGSSRFIVGSSVPTDRLANLDSVAVTLRRDDDSLHTARAGDVVGGQAQMLMTLINQIVAQGHILHRGDVVISGALGPAHAGVKGRYRADFAALGTIDFTLE